jgi:hypothetical protein
MCVSGVREQPSFVGACARTLSMSAGDLRQLHGEIREIHDGELFAKASSALRACPFRTSPSCANVAMLTTLPLDHRKSSASAMRASTHSVDDDNNAARRPFPTSRQRLSCNRRSRNRFPVLARIRRPGSARSGNVNSGGLADRMPNPPILPAPPRSSAVCPVINAP